VIFSLAKAKVPDLSSAKGGGDSTLDKGKSAPGKPTVIDRMSLNLRAIYFSWEKRCNLSSMVDKQDTSTIFHV